MNAAELLADREWDSLRLRLLVYPVQPESVRILPAPHVLRRVWGEGIRAMTLRQTIFVDPPVLGGKMVGSRSLLAHELVHVRQWFELGVLGFLWRYLGGYLRGRLSGLGHREAYLGIELEVEARRLADLA
ncbi:MAG TPA: DUF4157 domain-containing protein [Acidimicrobiia bacterium]|nr:DUF4157 domain-containing protein [Acidimicrobiia bacterium]